MPMLCGRAVHVFPELSSSVCRQDHRMVRRENTSKLSGTSSAPMVSLPGEAHARPASCLAFIMCALKRAVRFSRYIWRGFDLSIWSSLLQRCAGAIDIEAAR